MTSFNAYAFNTFKQKKLVLSPHRRICQCRRFILPKNFRRYWAALLWFSIQGDSLWLNKNELLSSQRLNRAFMRLWFRSRSPQYVFANFDIFDKGAFWHDENMMEKFSQLPNGLNVVTGLARLSELVSHFGD